MSRRILMLVLAACAVLGGAAPASAARDIGSIGQLGAGGFCFSAIPSGGPLIQQEPPADAITERSVLTRVRIGPFSTPSTTALRVFRPQATPGQLVLAATAPASATVLTPPAVPGLPGVPSYVADAPARVPLLPGDLFGFSGSGCAATPAVGSLLTAAGPVTEGVPFASVASPPPATLRLGYIATIERDGDGDGFGDETQDACPNDAARSGPCASDLGLSGGFVEAEVPVGRVAVLLVRIGNAGPPTDARVTLALPPGVELVGATPSQGRCSGATCELGALSKGGSAAIAVAVRPTVAGAFDHGARAAASNGDVDPANDALAARLTAVAAPTPAPPTQAVTPLVASTARTCRVPRLAGFSRTVAKTVLEAATCRLGSVTTRKVPRGRRAVGPTRVVAQRVAAGQERPGATRIDVTLGRRTVAAKRRRG